MSSHWICNKCKNRHNLQPLRCTYIIPIDGTFKPCENNSFIMITEMVQGQSLKRQSHKFTITQDVILDHALNTVQNELHNMNMDES